MAGRPRKPPSDLDRDRGGKSRAGAPWPAGQKVPPPPERWYADGRELTPGERECWVDLAAQVERRGTYDASFHEMFTLMVKRTAQLRHLEGVNNLSLGLMREVQKLHAKFGLSPRDSAYAATVHPSAVHDPYAEFREPGGDFYAEFRRDAGGGRPRQPLRVVKVAGNEAGLARPGVPGPPGTGDPTSTPPRKRPPWVRDPEGGAA